MNIKLLEWFGNQRTNPNKLNKLTTSLIKQKAMEIAKDLGRYYKSKGKVFASKIYFSFSASNGWFDGWLKRYNLSHRSRTSTEAPVTLKEPFETHMKK